MAELTPAPTDLRLDGASLSSQQFQTIAWLRWRIFLNSMRGKGAAGELVVRVLSYPFIGLMVFGPAVGAGTAAFYVINRGIDAYLAIPLWIIFALWQFIGVSTSTTGPTFDLATLARFPLRYRDYFLIRLSFGLLDIPTLSGCACLLAMCIGIGVAAPRLIPIAALTLFLYAVANILFSRMVYSWFERWMAQRRTRELLTGLIIVFSLAVQFGSQFLQRLNHTRHHHAPPNPWMMKTSHALLAVNWLLPPGLATSSIERTHAGVMLMSAAALAGLVVYSAVFLLILHLRLHAQYLGENLGEAPASGAIKTKKSKTQPNQGQPLALPIAQTTSVQPSLLPPSVTACLERELRYLMRSGPKLYALVMPVVMILLFSFRTAGLDSAGFGHTSAAYLFTYGCAYAQLIMVSLLYNSLGSDGAGIQFYFIAPVRFRDIMLAKNLMVAGILVVEIILMYIVAAIVSKPAAIPLTAATLAWSLFTLLINMSIGNIRSMTSPKVVEASRVRRQNVSGMNSLISLATVGAAAALGGLVQLLCTYLNFDDWVAAAIFLALSIGAFVLYLSVLRELDRVAANHRDSLIRELCKA